MAWPTRSSPYCLAAIREDAAVVEEDIRRQHATAAFMARMARYQARHNTRGVILHEPGKRKIWPVPH